MSRADFASEQAPSEHLLSKQIELGCSWMLSYSRETEICFYVFPCISFPFFLYSQSCLQDGERQSRLHSGCFFHPLFEKGEIRPV